MFPVGPNVIVAFVMFYVVTGALIGMLSGWLTSLALKKRLRLAMDAMLGAAGFLLGGIIAASMPWHPNTISYELSGGAMVTSTMNSYQYPLRVAAVAAAILPVIYEIWRSRRGTDYAGLRDSGARHPARTTGSTPHL